MCLSKDAKELGGQDPDDRFRSENSWAFNLIFWRYLDPKYFGPNKAADHRARLGRFTQKQREAMEDLVTVKMKEGRERKLREWDPDEAKAHLARFWN